MALFLDSANKLEVKVRVEKINEVLKYLIMISKFPS